MLAPSVICIVRCFWLPSFQSCKS